MPFLAAGLQLARLIIREETTLAPIRLGLRVADHHDVIVGLLAPTAVVDGMDVQMRGGRLATEDSQLVRKFLLQLWSKVILRPEEDDATA